MAFSLIAAICSDGLFFFCCCCLLFAFVLSSLLYVFDVVRGTICTAQDDAFFSRLSATISCQLLSHSGLRADEVAKRRKASTDKQFNKVTLVLLRRPEPEFESIPSKALLLFPTKEHQCAYPHTQSLNRNLLHTGKL